MDAFRPLQEHCNELEWWQQYDLDAKKEALLHSNLAVLYRKKIAGLRDALYEPEARDEAFEFTRSLIERVVPTPVEGELPIGLHGDLGGILSLCNDSKKPASSAKSRAEQIVIGCGGSQPPLANSPRVDIPKAYI